MAKPNRSNEEKRKHHQDEKTFKIIEVDSYLNTGEGKYVLTRCSGKFMNQPKTTLAGTSGYWTEFPIALPASHLSLGPFDDEQSICIVPICRSYNSSGKKDHRSFTILLNNAPGFKQLYANLLFEKIIDTRGLIESDDDITKDALRSIADQTDFPINDHTFLHRKFLSNVANKKNFELIVYADNCNFCEPYIKRVLDGNKSWCLNNVLLHENMLIKFSEINEDIRTIKQMYNNMDIVPYHLKVVNDHGVMFYEEIEIEINSDSEVSDDKSSSDDDDTSMGDKSDEEEEERRRERKKGREEEVEEEKEEKKKRRRERKRREEKEGEREKKRRKERREERKRRERREEEKEEVKRRKEEEKQRHKHNNNSYVYYRNKQSLIYHGSKGHAGISSKFLVSKKRHGLNVCGVCGDIVEHHKEKTSRKRIKKSKQIKVVKKEVKRNEQKYIYYQNKKSGLIHRKRTHAGDSIKIIKYYNYHGINLCNGCYFSSTG
jgi:hypothetical protein